MLAIGIGTSTRYNGDSNATLTTTGTATTLVNGEKTVVSGSTCYSKKYAYKVVLKSGDTIKLEVWSNQGNTSNEAILISF